MNFSNKFKRNWWYSALVIVGIAMIFRWQSIYEGQATDFDVGLLAIATALWLIPLFSEFTFMGLTLKQQIEQTKKEVENTKEDLKQEIREMQWNFRNELRNTVAVTNSAQQILYNNPPPDSYLGELSEQIISAIKNSSPTYRSDDELPYPSISPPDIVMTAFTGRFEIESELRKIWKTMFKEDAPRMSAYQLANELRMRAALSQPMLKSIQDVMRVLNPIVHGEQPTPEQVEFVKTVLPPIVEALRRVSSEKNNDE